MKFETIIIKSDYYSLRVRKAVDDSFQLVDVIEDQGMPKIYVECDESSGEILGFKIQTTSYGSLTPEEIENMITNYKIAIETIEYFEEALEKAI